MKKDQVVSAAVKAEAVRRHLVDKLPIKKLASELDVKPDEIAHWINHLFEQAETVFEPPRWRYLRMGIAAIIVAAGLAYTTLVVIGRIPESRQISATHLAILVLSAVAVTLLIAPKSLRRLKLLELSGFKLELLERVREKQLEQAAALDTIDLVLPLLLPATERAHLVNLADGRTGNYQGGPSLRAELRRLRSVGLIRKTGKGDVADLRSNMTFDLGEWIELTDLGRRWAHYISRMDQKSKGDESSGRASQGEGPAQP